MTNLTLAKIGTNQTVSYAASELARCLKAMDITLLIDQRTYDAYDPTVKNVIWVGKDGSLTPSDSVDEIRIDVVDGAGVITGANNRAVLIAVYRFLRELGCAWVRPGADGEIIPKKSLVGSALTVSVRETPYYVHRGICVEGSVMNEHIINMIEWLPRMGMNAYFVQNFVPTSFYRRWFRHPYNPFLEDENKTADDFAHMWKACEEEILKRGLYYHAVGHGWTYHPFGIHSTTLDPNDPMLTPEYKKHFALINGKRELMQAPPPGARGLGATQLCYSNPETREIMLNGIVEYCLDHPDVDMVHFWLADGMNNNCECDECRKMRPSDYYVMMLNELDDMLTAKGITTKIVFLVYVDLLWAPEKLKIKNPDRFLIMFAPISRTYSSALSDYDKSEPIVLQNYERNKLIMPKAVGPNIAHLAEWQKDFRGDGFIFDYHLMWDHFLDPGFTTCAKILHKDMCNLDMLSLNGSVSCQQQRCAFPTGLPMYAMAKGLWDKNSKFEDISREYYALAFGEDGPAVEAYLAKISELFDSTFMRNEKPEGHKDVLERMDAIDATVDAFKASHIDRNREKDASWNYLWYHADYCKIYANVIRAYTSEDEAQIEARSTEFTEFIFRNEPVLHTVHDMPYFNEVFPRWLKRVYSNKPTSEVDF